MSTNRASTANGAPEKTYFEQQREMLVGEIAQVKSTAPHLIHTAAHRCALNNAGHWPSFQSLELVLQNINKLNRSLEEVTQVGTEFAPVESLWSHFENVMAKNPNENEEGAQEGQTEHEGATEVTEHEKWGDTMLT
jgi:DASH complex subunit DAD1